MDFGSDDEGSSVGQAPSLLMRGTSGGEQQHEMMTMMDVDRREENGSYGMSAGEDEVDELDESSEEEEMEQEVFSREFLIVPSAVQKRALKPHPKPVASQSRNGIPGLLVHRGRRISFDVSRVFLSFVVSSRKLFPNLEG